MASSYQPFGQSLDPHNQYGGNKPQSHVNGGPVIVQGQVVNGTTTTSLSPAQVYNNGSSSEPTSALAGSSPHEAPPPRGCRDALFGILFYAHLGAVAYAAAVYTPIMSAELAEGVHDAYFNSNNDNGGGGRRLSQMLLQATGIRRWLQDEYEEEQQDAENNNQNEENEMALDLNALLTILCLASVVGLTLSSLGLGFMMTFAEGLIKIALWFNIILFGIMALLSFLAGAILGGHLFLLFAGFAAYYAYRAWDRIPFAAANLVAAVTAVRANLGLAFYAYWSVILLFLWSMLWATSASSTVYVLGGCSVEGYCENEVNGFVIFLFIFSYYWTAQVIANVVHVTTAGTVGTWWFHPHEASGCCSPAVRQSYWRSLTTSFGSICLGSLLVAIIQALKEMAIRAREDNGNILACVAVCILGCLESLMEMFNKWAFVYVGLYGFSFMEAGSNVMTLFRNRGWTAIIADLMVDTVLGMVGLCIGFLTAIVAVMIAAGMGAGDGATMGSAFLIGFLVGYALAATLFAIVSSAVNTVIVCYAEAPNEFQQNHPDLSTRMRDAWRQAWPNDFNY